MVYFLKVSRTCILNGSNIVPPPPKKITMVCGPQNNIHTHTHTHSIYMVLKFHGGGQLEKMSKKVGVGAIMEEKEMVKKH